MNIVTHYSLVISPTSKASRSRGQPQGLTRRKDSANCMLVSTKEGTIYVFRRKKKSMGQNETKFSLHLPKKEMKLKPDLKAGNKGGWAAGKTVQGQ